MTPWSGRGSLDSVRRRADKVVECGELVLCIEVLHAGTRSEGRVGRLFVRGEEVREAELGAIVTGTEGAGRRSFEFRGWDRPHLWSTSGWAVVDRDDDRSGG